MFKNITYIHFNSEANHHLFELEDSEFGIVQVALGGDLAGGGIVIVREHSKRNLDVGKNLALYVLWHEKEYRESPKQLCEWQDKYFPKYLPNWNSYIKSRDEHIQKLLLLQ